MCTSLGRGTFHPLLARQIEINIIIIIIFIIIILYFRQGFGALASSVAQRYHCLLERRKLLAFIRCGITKFQVF